MTVETNNDGIAIYCSKYTAELYVFYLLLKFSNRNCVFDSISQDTIQNFDTVWNINSIQELDETEILPDNLKTYYSTANNKLFCGRNLSNNTYFDFFRGYKIILYLDFDTHYEICKYLQVGFFENGSVEYKQNEFFLMFYNRLKSPAWPVCESVTDYYLLPEYVKSECLLNNDLQATLNLETFEEFYKNSLSKNVNGIKIDKNLVDTTNFNNADLIIDVKTILQTNGQNLFDALGIDYTAVSLQCKQFTDFYLNLYPENIKDLLAQ